MQIYIIGLNASPDALYGPDPANHPLTFALILCSIRKATHILFFQFVQLLRSFTSRDKFRKAGKCPVITSNACSFLAFCMLD